MGGRHERRTVDERLRLLTFPLDGGRTAVPAARHAIEEVLRCRPVSAELVDAVLLVASELVANAVEHGGGADRLELDWQQDSVVLRVWDRGVGRPQQRDLDPGSVRGRGLVLVQGLSEEWGCEPRSGGKSVWSRFSLVSA
ncbi:ATP-binding protein [Saccharopolyspora sp. MS10]|uniref:ATP-binding protein n=1 Tax=Saccharopolyspora sp. MS10 TaxID=3385973 RepID=UPI0039A2EC06